MQHGTKQSWVVYGLYLHLSPYTPRFLGLEDIFKRYHYMWKEPNHPTILCYLNTQTTSLINCVYCIVAQLAKPDKFIENTGISRVVTQFLVTWGKSNWLSCVRKSLLHKEDIWGAWCSKNMCDYAKRYPMTYIYTGAFFDKHIVGVPTCIIASDAVSQSSNARYIWWMLHQGLYSLSDVEVENW